MFEFPRYSSWIQFNKINTKVADFRSWLKLNAWRSWKRSLRFGNWINLTAENARRRESHGKESGIACLFFIV